MSLSFSPSGPKPGPLSRRKRSKGTIANYAGFAGGTAKGSSEKMNGDSTTDNAASSTSVGQGNQPQHGGEGGGSITQLRKHSYRGRLTLLCCQNSLQMGARTQLALCPPGRLRRALQSALRTRSPSSWRSSVSQQTSLKSLCESEPGGYYGLDRFIGAKKLAQYDEQEEDLLKTDTLESDGEGSSGDEEFELTNLDILLSADDLSVLDNPKKYGNLQEPLFLPPGGSDGNSNGSSMNNSTASRNLPFHFRKISYFDSVTASDRIAARKYLSEQSIKCKERDGMMLTRHLRRMQRLEKIRLKENGADNVVDETDSQEHDLVHGGVSQFPYPMTVSMSAALILESLALNPFESVEGMAMCYDGIVAAGLALLDTHVDGSRVNDEKESSCSTRSEIMTALAPLLITSLEQVSGEVIVALSRLRRMCGTPRYQRRFVQRVAPRLVRPPFGAIWCLQHQNDMEPILAASELIFDSTDEVFGKGWNERGLLLLADSKRAETLNSAAEQLRSLSCMEEDDSLHLSSGLGLIHKRHHKLMVSAASGKDGSSGSVSNEALAEWEVIAVDRQIRVSISNIMKRDWSRIYLSSGTKETDAVSVGSSSRNQRRAASAPSGISRKTAPTPPAEASPKALHQSPLNTRRPVKASLSPPFLSILQESSQNSTILHPESIESVFGPSFSTQPPSALVTAPSLSPIASEPVPTIMPPNTPPHHRCSGFEEDSRSTSPFTSPPQTPKSPVAGPSETTTPPRSPGAAQNTAPMPQSPRCGVTKAPQLGQISCGNNGEKQLALSRSMSPTPKDLTESRAPLSPAASTKSADSDSRIHRGTPASLSGSASLSSATLVSANYRMLTSTAAERKRTVAACRALRAQISRFEETFTQLHGRPPKGATERAPLATTYAQYREWKRAIRADAACRIQALFRGARTRWKLLKSSNPRMSHIVMTCAARPNCQAPAVSSSSRQDVAQANVLKQLSIPVEIGGNNSDRGVGLSPMPGSMGSVSGSQQYGDDDGIEVFISSTQSSPSESQPTASMAPHWSSALPRRPIRMDPQFSANGSSPHLSTHAASSSGTGTSLDMSNLTLSELQSHKRELKQQLKQYDMKFARKHGRMPVKSEKEPIRHLYENYNGLKQQISLLEQEAHNIRNTERQQQPNDTRINIQHLPSTLSQQAGFLTTAGEDTTSEDSHNTDSGIKRPGSIRMVRSRKDQPTCYKSFSSMDATSLLATSVSVSSGSHSQDLATLKAEKGKLHQMLRSYEKDFFKEHKRQVSSFADIKPVASQYRRYKEVKKTIASLQQSQHSADK